MMSPTTTTRLSFILLDEMQQAVARERRRRLLSSQHSPAADAERGLEPSLEAVHGAALLVVRVDDVVQPGVQVEVERALAAAEVDRGAPGALDDADEELGESRPPRSASRETERRSLPSPWRSRVSSGVSSQRVPLGHARP